MAPWSTSKRNGTGFGLIVVSLSLSLSVSLLHGPITPDSEQVHRRAAQRYAGRSERGRGERGLVMGVVSSPLAGSRRLRRAADISRVRCSRRGSEPGGISFHLARIEPVAVAG
jgi:hypothetical protein